ncbi:MAG TPA: ABC transporter permease [Oscillatoriaceae cyanobacterium]
MFGDFLRLSLRQLWAHRLRSFLTVLSIMIGAGAIVAMTSLAQSGLDTLTQGIEAIGGTRFVWILPDSPKLGKNKRSNYVGGLTMGDRTAIAQADAAYLDMIVADKRFYSELVDADSGGNLVTTVLATEPQYFGAFKLPIGQGRALTAEDLAFGSRVAVIGSELAQKLFPHQAALGGEVRFRGDRYRVVGVLAPHRNQNVQLGYEWNRVVIIPVTAPAVGAGITEISLTVRQTGQSDRAIRIANAILQQRHHGVDDYQFLDFGGLLKNFFTAFAIMKLVVGLIASVALLIGGVGVMNIMLVAVNERMREIGLRKALGATRAVILRQFLIEAVVLSLFGSVLGVASGLGVAEGASAVISLINDSWVPSISLPAVGIALVASATVGLFFGWYPAKRAAELEPIACLRHE